MGTEEIRADSRLLKGAWINVNGLVTNAKVQQIQLLLEMTNLDVLGITESKLTSDNGDKDIQIPGYKCLRRDRTIADGR